MLFMHNNKYLPLTGLAYLLCCSELYIIHREIFEIFQKYFMKYFRAKNFMNFYITNSKCYSYSKCVKSVIHETTRNFSKFV